MTAATNALCSGDGLRWLSPGEMWSGTFTVSYGRVSLPRQDASTREAMNI
jgi:hypothetical protein